jgi:hypothetical protein
MLPRWRGVVERFSAMVFVDTAMDKSLETFGVSSQNKASNWGYGRPRQDSNLRPSD